MRLGVSCFLTNTKNRSVGRIETYNFMYASTLDSTGKIRDNFAIKIGFMVKRLIKNQKESFVI